jgi:enoyl-CoA hydratase/carnithine racemase
MTRTPRASDAGGHGLAFSAVDYDGIIVRKDAGVEYVAEIVLDRPDALNALNTAMAESIAAACADLGSDPGVRAVVLSAAGTKAFCAGADLKERNAMTDAQILRQREVFRAAFGGVRDLPQPTVAAVHGYALGGGCEFAMSCDIIVADENAVFGLPEVTVGLVPGGGGTQLTLRRLGTGLAADLILTGRRVTVEEATQIGLVARRVPAGEARATAIEVAKTIAKNSPVAVKAAKRALRNGWGVPLDPALDIEDAAWRTAALSADRREGIAAFAEKRAPHWPGE